MAVEKEEASTSTDKRGDPERKSTSIVPQAGEFVLVGRK